MSRLLKYAGVFIFLVLLSTTTLKSQKINGVCFVSPSRPESFSNFHSLKRINAQWVAITPYAFSKKGEAHVTFNQQSNWWGEQTEGTSVMLQQAKAEGLKVMLKPHVWVMGEGWCGQFDLKTEEEWKVWELAYARYILSNAKIAEKYHVELLCIGTEYRIAAVKRSHYWKALIKTIRKVYSGKITYASNWDNYQQINFWDELDYIGVDAYFPLSPSKEVNTLELNQNWDPILQDLSSFSKRIKKPIIFTEFGYKSSDFSAWNQWEIESVRENELVNIEAQEKAYQTLFKKVWHKPWFGGGFLWKWYADDAQSGGIQNSDYTPQHKPVEKIVRQFYKQ
jgi:hypothetical protein